MSRPDQPPLPPAAAGPVADATVDFALEVIDRSAVGATAEAALRKPVGRKRSVPVTAVLAGLVLLALDDRPLLLTAVTDLLYRRISTRARRRLHLAEADTTNPRHFNARYRCVRYTFGLLCQHMDPSPLPKNRRLTADELAAATRPMHPAEAEQAREKLQTSLNALLQATVSLLSEQEYAAWDGSLGLDATPVPLFSRGPSQRTGLCAADPDGGWYVREGDHRDSEDHTGRKRTRIHWALEATIATMTRTPDTTTPGHPNLAIGIAFDRPGIDPAGTGVRVLASIRGRGHPPGWLGADRAYTAALPEKFHLPAAALGYRLVMDYRADQLGVQANTGGAILLEGHWCCPATPQPLISATADARARTIDDELAAQRIAARATYQLKPKDAPDVDGYYRMSCPALGNHARLTCPHRETPPTNDGRLPVLHPPDPAPKICTQTAITIAPDIGARHRQHLPFGTQAWASRYATLRNTIEGLNGYAKDGAHHALAAPDRRRIRGIAAQALFGTILLMAANLRKIRAHRALIANNRAGDIARRARRRRVSLQHHQPPTLKHGALTGPSG